MAVNSTVVVANLQDFIDRGLEDRLSPALEKVCLHIEREAKLLAPHGDGQLIGSISHKVEGLTGVVYSDVEYAPYVEIGTGIQAGVGAYHNEYMGTGRQTPWVWRDAKGNYHYTTGMKQQPFLEPAFDKCEPYIKEMFEGILDK